MKSSSNTTYQFCIGVCILILTLLQSPGQQPQRIASFGPNGTHWPDLIPTPFLYEPASLDLQVGASWQEIANAISGLTAAQVSEGVRILVAPGSLSGFGAGSGAQSVMRDVGSSSWSKRVTVCPRDGFGSVILTGGHRFLNINNVCFAGFINTGGIQMTGCNQSALAWIKTDYLKVISSTQAISKIEFSEVVVPDLELDNGDVSQIGADSFQVSNFRWDGCYFAPHYYISGTVPTPHTDTLQFYRRNASWNNWDMVIRDTAIFGSNNTAIQTGGVDGIDFIHSYLVNGSVNKNRYPVPSRGSTSGIAQAVNGAGQNWTAVDSQFFGSAGISNPSGLFSDNPFTSVTNSTVSFTTTGRAAPLNGTWIENSDPTFYLSSMPPYPTDEYLLQIWSSGNVDLNIFAAAPAFSPSAGVYQEAVTVTISSTTANAEIRYTTDGGTPDENSTLYSSPITIDSDTSLSAIAISPSLDSSETRTAEYLFRTRAPIIVPEEDSFFLQATEVSILNRSAGSTVYFTTNGTDPGPSSTVYQEPFPLPTSAVIKAIAIHPSLGASEVSSSTITIGNSLESSLQWQNFPLQEETEKFSVSWQATPNGNNIDAVTGISNGDADSFNDLACIVRFAPSGLIDARDGAVYRTEQNPEQIISYQGGSAYDFLMVVDIDAKTYDVFVKKDGIQVKIADGFAFRTNQSSLDRISNFAIVAPDGHHTIGSFFTISASLPPAPLQLRVVEPEE